MGAERYITPELKQYEETILGANEKIEALEKALYQQLLDGVLKEISEISLNARTASEADCLLSMAAAAEEYNYVRPGINDSLDLKISNGRHPVIERRLPRARLTWPTPSPSTATTIR